jgi:thiosulfate/3-mercaptopyruvate sulfurtransferase
MRSTTFAIVALSFANAALAADNSSYPRSDLLLELTELIKASDTFIVLDARSQEDYEQSHVPNAIWIDHEAWKTAFGMGDDASGWSKRIGNLGIAPESKVVVYDDNSSKDAARIWWILRYWGVRDARLLNGGWAGWKASEAPTQKDASNAPSPVAFSAKPNKQRLETRLSVLDSLLVKSLQVIDTRSESEHCGIEKRDNKRGGAIPGAKHLEWSDLIETDTQRFKSADELSKLFAEADIDIQRPTATHCQSGGRASVMVFGLELMGAMNVSNYYAGWSDWGNVNDTPIVERKPKKSGVSKE